MISRASRFFLARYLAALCVISLTVIAHATPYIPQDGGEVLEKLRSTAFDPDAREIRELRTRLSADPTNLSLACQYARRCIERSRAEADPRFLGRAQAALSPWWDLATPPIDALVLRATLKQSQHEFTNALADLDLAAHLAPGNPQIWLTRVTILTVLGDYAGARRACLPLVELAPGLIALTAAANVSSLNGGAESACGLLRNALTANSSVSAGEKEWALTALAEAEVRLGHNAEAKTDFKNALALGQHDPYLLGAYADLLLDEGGAPEVVEMLKNETRADALLLRLTLAEAAMRPQPAALKDHLAALSARYEAGYLRGDFVHQREQARFTLWLLGKPELALQLAQTDWQVQHEPADIRILLESALAAGNPAAARPALDFIRTNHLEDVELAKLAEQLNHR
jgi:hypothetical protein